MKNLVRTVYTVRVCSITALAPCFTEKERGGLNLKSCVLSEHGDAQIRRNIQGQIFLARMIPDDFYFCGFGVFLVVVVYF